MPVKKSNGRRKPAGTPSKLSAKAKRPKAKARTKVKPKASAKRPTRKPKPSAKRATRKPTRKAVRRKTTRRKVSRGTKSTGFARLTGSFDGDIHANGPVWIEKDAKCNARVHAPSVQLDGTMKGTVHAKNTMKLGPKCQMNGSIVADQLVCANGASFSGTCKIGRYRKAA